MQKMSQCESVDTANFPACTVQLNNVICLSSFEFWQLVKLTCILVIIVPYDDSETVSAAQQLTKIQPTCPAGRQC